MAAERAALLARSWTHSEEEDAEGRMVFRPADYDFPPRRRPRESLELHPDGRARHRGGPSPADRLGADDGTWALEDDELTLQLQGRTEQRHVIESVDEDRLVLRRAVG